MKINEEIVSLRCLDKKLKSATKDLEPNPGYFILKMLIEKIVKMKAEDKGCSKLKMGDIELIRREESKVPTELKIKFALDSSFNRKTINSTTVILLSLLRWITCDPDANDIPFWMSDIIKNNINAESEKLLTHYASVYDRNYKLSVYDRNYKLKEKITIAEDITNFWKDGDTTQLEQAAKQITSMVGLNEKSK